MLPERAAAAGGEDSQAKQPLSGPTLFSLGAAALPLLAIRAPCSLAQLAKGQGTPSTPGSAGAQALGFDSPQLCVMLEYAWLCVL